MKPRSTLRWVDLAVESLFRLLPSLNDVLLIPQVKELVGQYPRELVVISARRVLERIRSDIKRGSESESSVQARVKNLPHEIGLEIQQSFRFSLRRVINATGVVLHTNLGRAPLGRLALDHLMEVAADYSNLELDLQSGSRSRRDVHAESILLRALALKAGTSNSSTEQGRRAIVVNNCAAATFLALNSLAEGAEVIVSRGELVEIGGGFRIPDILRKSGAILREVGTTNKTRLSDYQSAISDRTALILRVHQSNFRMQGFTDRPSLEELVSTAAEAGIPIFEDQGTGLMMAVDSIEAADGSSLIESFRAAPDLIAASGDKLLGGPQCGILAGRTELIERILRNPLMRTFRVCKLTYAALEGTLLEYLAGSLESIPVGRMLSLSSDEIFQRCRSIAAGCTAGALSAGVIPTDSVIGGGTMPGATLKSFAVALRHKCMSSAELAGLLRESDPPVVARIKEEAVVLDLRTVPPESDNTLVSILNGVRVKHEGGDR